MLAIDEVLDHAGLQRTRSVQTHQRDQVVDRLVAIVGDSAIVQTQVQEEIQRMQLGGAPVPTPGSAEYDALFEQILNRFVDRLLVLQAAARDSLLQVSDETINERVSEQITQLATQFGGQAQFQEALAAEALTLAEYREILSNEQRVRQIERGALDKMRDGAVRRGLDPHEGCRIGA